jgi:hypothetical protein
MRARHSIAVTPLVAGIALICATSARAGEPNGRIIGTPIIGTQKTVAISEPIRGTALALPAAVADELQRAAPFPTAQVTGSRYRAVSGCTVESAELSAPIVASGTAALRVSGRGNNGRPCSAYAFVDVHVVTDALISTRPIREGAPLEGAVRMVRREIARGETPITALPVGVVASRSLTTGQLVDPQLFRTPGLTPGTPVRVMLRAGALSLEENGIIARCNDSSGIEHACATVASGKRVEGHFENGVILVEAP